MTFRENLGYVYFILPFISSIDNKYGLIFSILTGSSIYKIKIQNELIQIPKSGFTILLHLLGCLTYACSYSLDS